MIPYPKTFKLLGAVFILASLLFVLQKLWANKEFITTQGITPATIFALIAGAGVYALINVLLIFAWFWLLKLYHQTMSFSECFYIHTRTQIAKYLPGNIFHIAGRYALAYRFGISHVSLIGTTLYETIGMLIAAAIITLLGIAFLNIDHDFIQLVKIAGIFLGIFGGVFILNKMTPRFRILRQLNVPTGQNSVTSRSLFLIYSLYLAFFVATGGLFFSIIQLISGALKFSNFSTILVIFTLSWLLGFITPGSPGGFGVREAIIVGALSKFIGEADSVFVALSFRLVTIGGDSFLFLGSFLPVSNSITLKGAERIKTSIKV